MRYIEGSDRNQSLMFPELIDEYVDETNPVRFIDTFVDGLDLLTLGFSHALTHKTGRKPYNPADLLKLYIYGYLNKIRSSRRLEKSTYRNIEVMWLMHKLRPEFKTIADFRKDNNKAVKKVCREFIMLCKALGLFGCELIAIDGSKFSAVNHNNKCYTHNKLKHMLKAIDEKIDEYLSILEDEDHKESDVKQLSADELQAKIDSLEQRKAELSKVKRVDEWPVVAGGHGTIAVPLTVSECVWLGGTVVYHADCGTTQMKCVGANGHETCITEVK